jgi:hypothetical protein
LFQGDISPTKNERNFSAPDSLRHSQHGRQERDASQFGQGFGFFQINAHRFYHLLVTDQIFIDTNNWGEWLEIA